MSESRKQFEEWAKQFRYDLTISDPAYVNRPYVNDFTDWSWQAWSARDSEVERLREALTHLLADLAKGVCGCAEPKWAGWCNGAGEEFGSALDVSIANARAALSSQVKESGK